MLVAYYGVQGGVAPEVWKTGGGSVYRCRGQGPQQGSILFCGKAKGWLLESDTAYGERGNVGMRYVGFDVLD
jgi:hypothetical protein